MATMLTLVGEQPMPVLLPVRYLKPEQTILLCSSTTDKTANRLQRMIQNSTIHRIEAYEIVEIVAELHRKLQPQTDWIVNLTGGTKPMCLAAYDFAHEYHCQVVYFQSEGKESLLYSYHFNNDRIAADENQPKLLPELITISDYLLAHLPAFRVEGPHTENGKLDAGGVFEKALFELFKNNGFEAICGVRPEGVGNQIEIDLVVRLKNMIGVIEVKLGDKEGEGPKRGLDQLAMEAAREYLGTYAEKFLITARKLPPQLYKLAAERKMMVIELQRYRTDGRIDSQEANYLLQQVRRKLQPMIRA